MSENEGSSFMLFEGDIEKNLMKYVSDPSDEIRQELPRAILRLFEHQPLEETLSQIHFYVSAILMVSEDKMPVVRASLIEQISYIFLFCHKNSYYKLSYYLYDRLLQIVLQYLQDEDVEVRREAYSTLTTIIIEKCIQDENTIEKQICPVILSITQENCIESQTEFVVKAITIMSRLMPLIGQEKTEKIFLNHFISLCSCKTNNVRKVCATIYPIVCHVLGREITENKLIGPFCQLCDDIFWGVRKACAESIPLIALTCSIECRKDKLTPLVLELANDISKWVVNSTNKILGEFMATFAQPCLIGLAYTYNGDLKIINPMDSDFTELSNPELMSNYENYSNLFLKTNLSSSSQQQLQINNDNNISNENNDEVMNTTVSQLSPASSSSTSSSSLLKTESIDDGSNNDNNNDNDDDNTNNNTNKTMSDLTPKEIAQIIIDNKEKLLKEINDDLFMRRTERLWTNSSSSCSSVGGGGGGNDFTNTFTMINDRNSGDGGNINNFPIDNTANNDNKMEFYSRQKQQSFNTNFLVEQEFQQQQQQQQDNSIIKNDLLIEQNKYDPVITTTKCFESSSLKLRRKNRALSLPKCLNSEDYSNLIDLSLIVRKAIDEKQKRNEEMMKGTTITNSCDGNSSSLYRSAPYSALILNEEPTWNNISDNNSHSSNNSNNIKSNENYQNILIKSKEQQKQASGSSGVSNTTTTTTDHRIDNIFVNLDTITASSLKFPITNKMNNNNNNNSSNNNNNEISCDEISKSFSIAKLIGGINKNDNSFNNNNNNNDDNNKDKSSQYYHDNNSTTSLEKSKNINNDDNDDDDDAFENFNSYKYWYIEPDNLFFYDNDDNDTFNSSLTSIEYRQKEQNLSSIKDISLTTTTNNLITRGNKILFRLPSNFEQNIMPASLLQTYVGMALECNEEEINLNCAYSFPGVALTIGKQNWHLIKPVLQYLCDDLDWKVRKTIASSIDVLAKILGKEIASNDLVPVYIGFFKDIDEVKIEAIRNFAYFLKAVDLPKHDEILSNVGMCLKVDSTMNWHIKEDLAKQIYLLIKMYEPINKLDNLLYLTSLTALFLEDKISCVREIAVDALISVIQICDENYREAIIKIFVANEFALSDNWRKRQTFLNIIYKLITCDPSLLYLFHMVLNNIEKLSLDPVPNIRLFVAKILVQLINIEPNIINAENSEDNVIIRMLKRIRDDKDRGVREIYNFAHLEEIYEFLRNDEQWNDDEKIFD